MGRVARPILLDVDTGTDDALALLYAVRHPDLEVLGVSCVTGNASVEQVVINTLKVLDAADAPYIPVARGRPSPWSSAPARRAASTVRTAWAGCSCRSRPDRRRR